MSVSSKEVTQRADSSEQITVSRHLRADSRQPTSDIKQHSPESREQRVESGDQREQTSERAYCSEHTAVSKYNKEKTETADSSDHNAVGSEQ
jgi:hypothetical protein